MWWWLRVWSCSKGIDRSGFVDHSNPKFRFSSRFSVRPGPSLNPRNGSTGWCWTRKWPTWVTRDGPWFGSWWVSKPRSPSISLSLSMKTRLKPTLIWRMLRSGDYESVVWWSSDTPWARTRSRVWWFSQPCFQWWGFAKGFSKSAFDSRSYHRKFRSTSVRISTSFFKASISASFKVCDSSFTISCVSYTGGSCSVTIYLFFFFFPHIGAIALLDHWWWLHNQEVESNLNGRDKHQNYALVPNWCKLINKSKEFRYPWEKTHLKVDILYSIFQFNNNLLYSPASPWHIPHGLTRN